EPPPAPSSAGTPPGPDAVWNSLLGQWMHVSGVPYAQWQASQQQAVTQSASAPIMEGRSLTQSDVDRYLADARSAGIPEDYISDFIARHPGDYNRIRESYSNVPGAGDSGSSGGNQFALRMADMGGLP